MSQCIVSLEPNTQSRRRASCAPLQGYLLLITSERGKNHTASKNCVLFSVYIMFHSVLSVHLGSRERRGKQLRVKVDTVFCSVKPKSIRFCQHSFAYQLFIGILLNAAIFFVFTHTQFILNPFPRQKHVNHYKLESYCLLCLPIAISSYTICCMLQRPINK